MAENLPKFRREFKRYKQRKPLPDLSDVIDFELEETWKGRVLRCLYLLGQNKLQSSIVHSIRL